MSDSMQVLLKHIRYFTGLIIVRIFCQTNYAEISLIENLQRQDLTCVEEAEALERLMKEQSLTQEQLGGIVGKARTTVRDILTLNHLPQAIRDECRGDRIITRQTLIEIARKNMETFHIRPPESITLTEPLSYMEFLNLWKDAKLALTDSGGLQEETTALGIPCLTLRENTERPITVTQGTNELMGTSQEKILSAFGKIMGGEWKIGQRPQFWDGKAAVRILHIVE